MKTDMRILYGLAMNYEYPQNLEEINLKWELGSVEPLISFKAIHNAFGVLEDFDPNI